ncbi:MAG: hypothetical protein GY874_09235 [Desulfobacteraceae bacterium]|nr:hypothetical protein [Desulfobacteraceae bacterium]
MAFWSVREELSQNNRLRRSYYELLRDQLDQFMLGYALVNSYKRFLSNGMAYPFIEKRELKPRARISSLEYEHQNTFLVIFVEDTIPAKYKKYIRFFNLNKTTKYNLLQAKALPMPEIYDRNQKLLESARFFDFLKTLLPFDYALLIQRDPASRLANRYHLSHFHVRIDWPITEAAEDMAQNLRYISKDLYEKGDKYAENLQKKFFEYYGMPVMIGGRRTAAVVAAQYLKRIPCITTVYAGSSQARVLFRISERGVSKAVLIQLNEDEMSHIADVNSLTLRLFKKYYVIASERKKGICMFQATYTYTNHARVPDDNKLRELNPDVNWLTIGQEHLLPKPQIAKYPPLAVNWVYS